MKRKTEPIVTHYLDSNIPFHRILIKAKSIHDKKNHDYASEQDRFSNFTEAASEVGCSVDTVFRVLIGIKNSRIKQLLTNGKSPNNESIEDSFWDRFVYCGLHLAWLEKADSLQRQLDRQKRVLVRRRRKYSRRSK